MERVLGIDPGEARFGVAISDELGLLAHPLETIFLAKCNPLDRIVELSGQHHVAHIVVGVARNMDGSNGAAAEKALAFIHEMRQRVGCPVTAWDERWSTVQARRQMREAGRKEIRQKEVIDQAAAQIILQSWLDTRPPLFPEADGGPLHIP